MKRDLMRHYCRLPRLAFLTSCIVAISLASPIPVANAQTRVETSPTPTTQPVADDTLTPGSLLGIETVPEARKSRDFTTESVFPAAELSQGIHTLDIAVVAPAGTSGSTGFITDADISGLVTAAAAFWKQQSNQQVMDVLANSSTKRFASSYNCGQQREVWEEAAVAFGRTTGYYVAPQGHHLLVLTPHGCGGGLGSLGSFDQPVSAANGGVIWAPLGSADDLATVVHEFGHNLGLEHSNTHYCPNPAMSEGLPQAAGAFSDGCLDHEYEDSYDVMGWAISAGTQTNLRPTALNVTQKSRLNAVAPGEVSELSLPTTEATRTTSFTLESAGQEIGLRALKVTDPRTGQIYFIDFRGGTGTDAGSLYASGLLRGIGVDIGVRLLTVRSSGASVVLNTPDTASNGSFDNHKLYLAAGEEVATRSGGVKVAVKAISGGHASVAVTLSGVSSTSRISGPDRYTTALAVAKAGYPDTARIVYVATGTDYPDALAAAPAAALKGGPLLLTDPVALPLAVKSAIQTLKPERIVVVGGVKAISSAVFSALKALAPTVTRMDGVDRYETARKVVADAFGPVADAYVATALNYPDALSAAAAAGAQGRPVLLVNGAGSAIDQPNLTLMKSLGITKLTVVGGTAVVSTGVEQSLRAAGITVTRLGGVDRFRTSQLVNGSAFPSASEVFLATGYQFPDALAGAALAGARKAPLYVVLPYCVPNEVLTDVTRLGASLTTLIGGASALDSSVEALKRC